MTTKLDKQLRREVKIAGEPWVITITPQLLKLTRKGRRKGIELEWKALVSGDAGLAAALKASVRPTPKRRSVPDEPAPRSTSRR